MPVGSVTHIQLQVVDCATPHWHSNLNGQQYLIHHRLVDYYDRSVILATESSDVASEDIKTYIGTGEASSYESCLVRLTGFALHDVRLTNGLQVT